MKHQLFKVKLNPLNSAEADQQIHGYLAAYNRVMKYTRGEAIKKAKMFGGKIESATTSKKTKLQLLLEIKNGTLIFTASTSNNIDITLIDHDWDEAVATRISIDKIMSHPAIKEYITKSTTL